MTKPPIPVTRPNDFETYPDAKKRRAPLDFLRDLALAETARKRRFAAIVRFVRRCEAGGPAKHMMAQIRRDHELCKLLVEYETQSELIGIMEFVRDLKTKPSRRVSKSTDRKTR